ncbi:MAG: helix-turn-helix domain-containing protein [Reyranellaceae bacterium]
MKPSEWAVLMVLADCHNPVNGCFPSQDYICAKTNLGERAVRDQLARLRERGLIDWDAAREGQRRGSNRYRLGFEPDFQPANSAGRDEGTSTGKNEPSQPAESDALNRQNLPPNPVREPVKEPEREGAGARGQEGQPETDRVTETVIPAETPGRADFEKRVMKFCTGKGFAAGPWPDWDTSSPGWVARQFAALTPAERAEAERWRDAYLLDIAGRKAKPVAVGNFLNGRMWAGLDPAILERAERQKQARLSPEERPQPEGWAACLGPVGMAWLFGKLLAGPADAEMARRPFLADQQLREAWPALWWFQAMLRQKGGAVFDPQWHALKGAMEPVPLGCNVLAAWRAEFEARGWRWLAAFDGAPVVYCPKGGPVGLADFDAALRRAQDGEDQGNDGGGREAAE